MLYVSQNQQVNWIETKILVDTKVKLQLGKRLALALLLKSPEIGKRAYGFILFVALFQVFMLNANKSNPNLVIKTFISTESTNPELSGLTSGRQI